MPVTEGIALAGPGGLWLVVQVAVMCCRIGAPAQNRLAALVFFERSANVVYGGFRIDLRPAGILAVDKGTGGRNLHGDIGIEQQIPKTIVAQHVYPDRALASIGRLESGNFVQCPPEQESHPTTDNGS